MSDPAAQRHHRIEELFQLALEREVTERTAFLREACDGDAALEREVTSLLALHPQAGGFLETPILGFGADDSSAGPDVGITPTERADASLRPYRLVRRIGSGGMGTVWLAERDDEHYRHRVAIKLIKRGMDTDELLVRFRNERQVLANLEHANIARLLDGGAADDG